MYGVGFGYGSAGATTILKSGAAIDADAQSFFTASGITDATQKNAVNQLVLDLKSNNLWTKMKALYPVVGGNATAHSYNLKNTAQYQLSFSSGWTHSSTGMTPNGTSAYADTGFNPSTQLTLNNIHLSVYGRANSTSVSSFIGAFNGTNRCHLLPNANSVSYNSINTSNAYAGSGIATDGLILASRLVSTTGVSYKNGTSVYSDNTTSDVAPNLNIYLSALNLNNASSYYSGVECAIYTIGEGLTPTESANFYTIVQNFQTSLSRNV